MDEVHLTQCLCFTMEKQQQNDKYDYYPRFVRVPASGRREVPSESMPAWVLLRTV